MPKLTINPLRSDICATFGEQLNKTLDEQGMRQGRGRAQDLSVMLDISVVAASKYLQGRMCPALPVLVTLSTRLNTSIDYLLGVVKEPSFGMRSEMTMLNIPLLGRGKSHVAIPSDLVPIKMRNRLDVIFHATSPFSDTIRAGDYVLLSRATLPFDQDAIYLVKQDAGLRFAKLRAVPRRNPHTLKINYGMDNLLIAEWRKVALDEAGSNIDVEVVGKAIGRLDVLHTATTVDFYTAL